MKKESKIKTCTMERERWICKDGEWGGWHVWQCDNCWGYQNDKYIADKRVKYCPECEAKIVKRDRKFENGYPDELDRICVSIFQDMGDCDNCEHCPASCYNKGYCELTR